MSSLHAADLREVNREMVSSPCRVRRRRPSPAAAAIAWMLPLLAVAGCTGNRYTYRTVPREYLARPAENVEETGLTKLHVPSVNSQLIDLGDVLEVTITTDSGDSGCATTPVRVERDGAANVPLIGRVSLVGMELDEAEQVIAAQGRTRGIFKNPQVLVEMKRPFVNRITVLGAVADPGIHDLSRAASSLLGALVAAGDLTEDAGPEIIIRRPVAGVGPAGPLQPPEPRMAGGGAELTSYQEGGITVENGVQIFRVNLTRAAVAGNAGGHLQDGDVVIVPKRAARQVYVMGLVRKPDVYDLPLNRDTRLLDALAMAGERTVQVADKVIVIRQVPDRREPAVIQLSIREAKANGAANILLAPGDVVSVEETPATVVVKAITDVIRIGIGGNMAFF